MTDAKFLLTFGARIKELRLVQNMTQNDLAFQCGLGNASMSRIESGKANITVLTLKKISSVLEIEVHEFFKH